MGDIFEYIDMCVYIKYHSEEEYKGSFENIKHIISEFKLHNPTKNFNNEMRGQFSYTPLHYAVLRNDFGLVQLFIHEGADPTIRIMQSVYKKKGILPLYLAEDFGKIEITAILKPYTEEWLIKNYFYNSITHYTINNKKQQTPTHLHQMYIKINPNIDTIKLIQNRLPIDMFLPNELWIKILEMCQLKDYIN